MIGHLAKLVWSRRGKKLLLVVEIFVSFLVVFAVTLLGSRLVERSRHPLGFDWRDVWSVQIDTGQTTDDVWSEEMATRVATLLREVEGWPDVSAVGGALMAPFELGGSSWEWRGETVRTGEVTDGVLDVLDLRLVAGRWFGPDDDAAEWRPGVVNARLARLVAGSPEAAVGSDLELGPTTVVRVVGVIADYREAGELAPLTPFLLFRQRVGSPDERPARRLLLELAPGSSTSLEAEILDRLRRLAPGWSFEVRPLAQLRRSARNLRLAPLVMGSVVSVFLLLMVALGLLGVLWQDVTGRREEIGLRRAVGATAADVHRQILGEILVVAAVGVTAGLVVVLQLPLLGVVGGSAGVFAAAMAVSSLVVLVLVAASALYPSWFATRVAPALALRDE